MHKDFGLLPMKEEGEACHPDAMGMCIMGTGYLFLDDESYLKQLQAYAKWRGKELTKKTFCSRPHLLKKL